MKISLAWLFDHIDADWKKVDVPALVSLFNKTTAEIEGFKKIHCDLSIVAAAKITSITGTSLELEIPEWGKKISMAAREGAQKGEIYLVAQENGAISWAKLSHLESEKEGLLPAFKIDEPALKGEWKKSIEVDDVILHLDNKSINHRPDMWGHRGVAREVAAILNLPFKALDAMLLPHTLKEYEKKSVAGKDQTFTVAIENPESCGRFAGLFFEQVTMSACLPWMAGRLARVDSRPINAIVDATNYVMLDLSQPMHAFDGAALSDKTIIVRNAKNKETLVLLDGQTVSLTSDDCVVTDGKKALSLAGIMGGKDSGVSSTTKSIFLESASFTPTVIRKTAARIKKRSESSARFEKSLDPNQIVIAIGRFLRLLDDAKITYKANDAIAVVDGQIKESLDTSTFAKSFGGHSGRTDKNPFMVSASQSEAYRTIHLSHAYIEQLLGTPIASDFVIKTLQKLEFAVDYKNDSYSIVVPTFRATKDIAIKQDIVEEIGRFYGYDKIVETLPSRQTKPFELTAVMHTRRIKQLLAYTFRMQEVYTYAFFDESFLKILDWQPGKTLQVQEAVSQNWQRLATTLVPNLLKMVHAHAQEKDVMNFFEWAQIWPYQEEVMEKSSLAGIFVNQKKSIDFYDIKLQFCSLAQLLGLSFEWIKANPKELTPWYMPYQTAYLLCKGKTIGIAGKVNPSFFSKVALGDAFIFELDGNFLLSYQSESKQYMPVSKYPGITRDISIMIPLASTVKELRTGLQNIDAKIKHVALVDFFEKPEWDNQKSVTFRIMMADDRATMAATQADAIMNAVADYLKKQGAVVR